MEYSLENVLDHVKKQSFSDISKLEKEVMLHSSLLESSLSVNHSVISDSLQPHRL